MTPRSAEVRRSARRTWEPSAVVRVKSGAVSPTASCGTVSSWCVVEAPASHRSPHRHDVVITYLRSTVGRMTDERLDALELRLAALEAHVARPGGEDDERPLWALEALRDRVEDPGAVLLVGQVELPDERRAQWQLGAGTGDLLGGDWAEHADTLTALGHPVRLRLLQRVLGGVATVNELTETDGVGTSGQ